MAENSAKPVKNRTNNPNGRPKGSRNKLRATDFFNGEERDRLIEQAKLLTIDSNGKPDKDMVKFLWEQLFGKASQRLEHAADEDNPLVLQIAESIANKYDSQRQTKRDSQG